MVNRVEEKRAYPRVKADFTAVLGRHRVRCTDFSEGGVRFAGAGNGLAPLLAVELPLPNLSFALKTKGKLAWSGSQKDHAVGIEFTQLKDVDRSHLREALIRTDIEDFLSGINDKEAENNISFFFADSVKSYMDHLVRFASLVCADGGHDAGLQRELDQANMEILLKGYSLNLLLDDQAVMRKVKNHFRSLIGTWARKGALIKMALEKPEGIPNDYRLLEAIYDKNMLTSGPGAYFDAYFLNSPYAVALRSRKDWIRDRLSEYTASKRSRPSLKILSIGCGPCREIAEFIASIPIQIPLDIVGIDADNRALGFAGKRFERTPSNIRVNFIHSPMTAVSHSEKELKLLAQQDLIYLSGLADHLPDSKLKGLLAYYVEALRPGGSFIVTLNNREKSFAPLMTDWFCGWESVSRSREEFLALLRSVLPGFSVDVETDDFGFNMYFTMKKL